jgi:membrane protein implicated in regulation of membrane protease activity
MNRAFLIIGVPAVGVATFYTAVLWGRWAAATVAIVLTLALAAVAVVDRRRRANRQASTNRSEASTGH